jgi:hypothetical protein
MLPIPFKFSTNICIHLWCPTFYLLPCNNWWNIERRVSLQALKLFITQLFLYLCYCQQRRYCSRTQNIFSGWMILLFATFYMIFTIIYLEKGARGGTVCWGTALQAGRSRVRFPIVSLEFFIDTILPAALWPWSWLSSNRNEYQDYFMGGKGGRCVGLTTLPPSCAECLEIWEPQPLGTL